MTQINPQYTPGHPSDQELLDVVDEHNQVIGQATRGECHSQGLMHRSVHIFLLNDDGHLYIQKRSAHKDTFAGAHDSSVAGHVDAGEGYYDCAIREMGEELGLSADQVELVQVGELGPSEDNGFEHVRFYLARTTHTPQPNPEEVAEGYFLTLDQVEDLIGQPETVFAPTFRILYFYYVTQLAPKVAEGLLFEGSTR